MNHEPHVPLRAKDIDPIGLWMYVTLPLWTKAIALVEKRKLQVPHQLKTPKISVTSQVVSMPIVRGSVLEIISV
jgi:hypothetical protein